MFRVLMMQLRRSQQNMQFSAPVHETLPGSGLSSQVYTWRGGMERALRVDLQQERTDGAWRSRLQCLIAWIWESLWNSLEGFQALPQTNTHTHTHSLSHSLSRSPTEVESWCSCLPASSSIAGCYLFESFFKRPTFHSNCSRRSPQHTELWSNLIA